MDAISLYYQVHPILLLSMAIGIHFSKPFSPQHNICKYLLLNSSLRNRPAFLVGRQRPFPLEAAKIASAIRRPALNVFRGLDLPSNFIKSAASAKGRLKYQADPFFLPTHNRLASSSV
eukprot:Protomagalhaensia_sp_Gyna_25__1728@NODE_1902_length_1431_cov_20_533764_g1564_i0_p2_GENE_NODE_1902_length_1431_cov_20_533764_g1564_i0NODE_1902_length_1431_cov_20_533764_g1564_i0_p2_ORF_typecomplete_len118_score10_94_NODE_1902_length_1431_cov_20_533764_g1564_i09741327